MITGVAQLRVICEKRGLWETGGGGDHRPTSDDVERSDVNTPPSGESRPSDASGLVGLELEMPDKFEHALGAAGIGRGSKARGATGEAERSNRRGEELAYAGRVCEREERDMEGGENSEGEGGVLRRWCEKGEAERKGWTEA